MSATLSMSPSRQAGRSRTAARRARAAGLAALLGIGAAAAGTAPPAAGPSAALTRSPTPASASAAPDGKALPKVAVRAPAPQYVAPTLRDQIGRIWAPVYLNGKGPFRLVLDTGATESVVTAGVAKELGIALDHAAPVLLHGVTGTAVVPTIRVDTLRIGDLQRDNQTLPIVPDALGGADGVLGTEGLLGKRIFIDFRDDRITIRRSFERRAPIGYVTIPLEIVQRHLLTTNARVGTIPVTAIIDTGSETSIANLALRQALLKQRSSYRFSKDQIVDTTDAVAPGKGTAVPPIFLGAIAIYGSHITTGDLHIFDVWHLTKKPAILIGMDALGMVNVLIIDYRMQELQILTRSSGFDPPLFSQ